MSDAWASAGAYDRHVGRYSPALARALMEHAAVSAGMRALDVGCGPGGLTAELAAALGAGAVAAADPSEPFAAACRERVPGADVHVAPAERLPFGDGEFDAALAQLVVNFMDDAHAGLREMRRVTRRGGVVAAAVWDYAEGMTLLRAFWDAAREAAPAQAGDHDEGSVMRFCRPAELEALWCEALEDVRVAAVVVRARYADFDSLWEPFERGVGPTGAFAVACEAPTRAALRDAMHRRLGSPEGGFELSARAWCAAGRVA